MISTVPIAVGAIGTTMPGERRLYKTRKGKAVAHGLWPCSQTPGASAVPLASGPEKPSNPENHHESHRRKASGLRW